MRADKLQVPRILVIGALPPPFMGPTVAMERLLGFLRGKPQYELSFLDISDHRDLTSMGKADATNFILGFKHVFQCLVSLFTRRPHLVYIGISQSRWALARDLCFLIPSRLLRCRIVIHLRGSELNEVVMQMPSLLRGLTRWTIRGSSRVIVLGECLRHVFADLTDPRVVRVVPNGISVRHFSKCSVARQHEVNGFRLLYIGCLIKRKGLLQILQALPAIAKRYPRVSLTVAGDWTEKEFETEARAELKKTQMSEAVRFVGPISGEAKLKLLQDHDVFVFTPIEPEGLPWVILEAMSAGLPVITTAQGAIAEVVVNGGTGLIVEPTAASVADAVCKLLGDPKLASAMGKRGRERAEEKYSEEKYFDSLEAVFQEALSEEDVTATPEVSWRLQKSKARNSNR